MDALAARYVGSLHRWEENMTCMSLYKILTLLYSSILFRGSSPSEGTKGKFLCEGTRGVFSSPSTRAGAPVYSSSQSTRDSVSLHIRYYATHARKDMIMRYLQARLGLCNYVPSLFSQKRDENVIFGTIGHGGRSKWAII